MAGLQRNTPAARPEPPLWEVGVAAVAGALVGAIAFGLWRWEDTESHRCMAVAEDDLDCLGAPVAVWVVGPPVTVALLWVAFAVLRVRAWVAPVITLGGLGTLAYATRLYRAAVGEAIPPVWVGAGLGVVSLAAVAVACLPRLPLAIRAPVVLSLAALWVMGVLVGR